jgi:hypothetical protein
MMTKTIRLFRPLSLVAALSLGGGIVPQMAAAATSFDGMWAVEIVASNGNCPARTIPIAVEDGRIHYSAFGATAEGAISPDGALNVSFAHRNDVVRASGAVDGGSGAGNWRSAACEGSWTARRG